MPFDLSKEKMLCLMMIDDSIAHKLSSTAGPAFWRGFILEDRETHKVSGQFRFSYEGGEKTWFKVSPPHQTGPKEAAAELRCKLEDVLRLACRMMGGEMPEDGILCFYPPDDEGEPLRTILWLEERDLVEVTVRRNENDDEPLSEEPERNN